MPFDFSDFDLSSFLPSTDPAFLSGLGAQMAATYMRSQANKRVTDQQNMMMALQRQKQQALQAEADANINKITPTMTREAQDAARMQQQARLEQSFTPTSTMEGEYLPDNPGAPEVVKSDLARQIAGAVAKGKSYAKASAGMAAYGQQNLNNNIALGRNAQDMSMLGDFSRGTSSILPYQLKGAQKAGQSLNTASDVLNGAGQLGALYGLTRPKKAAAPGWVSGYDLPMGK